MKSSTVKSIPQITNMVKEILHSEEVQIKHIPSMLRAIIHSASMVSKVCIFYVKLLGRTYKEILNIFQLFSVHTQ